MDETLIVFNELLNGKYAAANSLVGGTIEIFFFAAAEGIHFCSQALFFRFRLQDATVCDGVGQALETAIFSICDEHLFFKQLEVGRRGWCWLALQHMASLCNLLPHFVCAVASSL